MDFNVNDKVSIRDTRTGLIIQISTVTEAYDRTFIVEGFERYPFFRENVGSKSAYPFDMDYDVNFCVEHWEPEHDEMLETFKFEKYLHNLQSDIYGMSIEKVRKLKASIEGIIQEEG
jgi:hypothetical protein